MQQDRILVIGACGQIGTELVTALRLKYGTEAVIAADRHVENTVSITNQPYIQLDVTDRDALNHAVANFGLTQIYHLAAMLSANGEKDPQLAWQVNMDGLLNVLEVARLQKISKVFWPSSIAVFGPSSPKILCPQQTVTQPSTVYGISKCAGEFWCEYYFNKYGIDVRSIRYPGLISHSAMPGGGTTDYAVDIYHKALDSGKYTCFLSESTFLPMMYMPDAIRATLELMDAPAEQLRIRTAYNLSAFSFTPAQLADHIQHQIPTFSISYEPDYRQQIADSWPGSIDDSYARQDWNWKPEYDLKAMTADMLHHLKAKHETMAAEAL